MMKILAIDDNKDNLISLKAIINDSFPGSVLYTSLNGQKGIEFAIVNDPDVILLDIIMADRDGFEVCRRLKQNQHAKDIPVVFLTTIKGDKKNLVKALEAGAEAFLSKPIDATELTVQIKAMVKIKSANRQKYVENERLNKLVAERTRELEQIQITTMNLLDELKAENEARKSIEEELRESETHFRTLADSGQALIWTSGVDKKCNYFNQTWLNFTGRTLQQELGDGWVEGVHPDDLQHCVDIYTNAFHRREKFSMEYRIRHFGGEYRWIQDDGTPRYNSNGDFLGYIGHCLDISEHKLAGEVIKLDEARLESLLKITQHPAESIQELLDFALNESIILTGSKIGYIYFYNEKRKEFTLNTWSREVMQQCSIEKPLTVYELEKTGIWGEAVRQGRPVMVNNFDAKNPLKRGVPEGHAPLHKFLTIPVFSEGHIVAVVGVANKVDDYNNSDIRQLNLMMDVVWKIVQRKEVEEAISMSETRLRRAELASGSGNWELHIDSKIMIASEGAIKIYGIREVQFDYSVIKNISLLEYRQLLDNALLNLIENNEPYDIEFKIKTVDTGEIKDIHSVAIYDKEKGTLFGIIQDTTENKRILEALRESESRLCELNATKDKFFSIISHDLKNPFNAIIGFSNILVEKALGRDFDRIVEYARIIENSSQRAMDLLTNLLEWSRSQAGRMKFIPEKIDIVALINDVETLLKDAAEQKSISISTENLHNATVFADKAMIGTILRNLISNAVKFTNPGGKIVISIKHEPHQLKVIVSDNGVGIRTEVIDRLFRIDETLSTKGTFNEDGTGLGLILCKEFVDKHGGEIWVDSEVGKGSMFCFTIPNN